MVIIFTLLAIIAEILGTVGGFGSSILFVPLAQMFFEVKTVLGLTAVFHVFSNLSKLVLFRKSIDWKLTLLFGIPGVIFVLLGAWLTTFVSFRFDQVILALFLITFSLLFLIKPNLKVTPNVTGSITGGGIAGFLAGYIGTGGAVRGLFLAAYNLEKSLFAGTSAAIDMGVDLSRAVVYLDNGFVTSKEYYLVPILIVISVVGSYIGKLILLKLNQDVFRKIVLVLIFGVGLFTLVKSIMQLSGIKFLTQ